MFEVVKKFEIGQQYSHAMLEMEFKFVNSFWANNTAYIKINEHIYWMENHNFIATDDLGNYY
jgi:hypothetical protein